MAVKLGGGEGQADSGADVGTGGAPCVAAARELSAASPTRRATVTANTRHRFRVCPGHRTNLIRGPSVRSRPHERHRARATPEVSWRLAELGVELEVTPPRRSTCPKGCRPDRRNLILGLLPHPPVPQLRPRPHGPKRPVVGHASGPSLVVVPAAELDFPSTYVHIHPAARTPIPSLTETSPIRIRPGRPGNVLRFGAPPSPGHGRGITAG
jgi:hypothetical protein